MPFKAPRGGGVRLARAEEMMPTWRSIAMRITARAGFRDRMDTPRPGDPINVTSTDAEHWNQEPVRALAVAGESRDRRSRALGGRAASGRELPGQLI
jgi:hypothetical protein